MLPRSMTGVLFVFFFAFLLFLPSIVLFFPSILLPWGPYFLPSCLSDVQHAATDRKWQNTCQNQCHLQKITSQNPWDPLTTRFSLRWTSNDMPQRNASLPWRRHYLLEVHLPLRCRHRPTCDHLRRSRPSALDEVQVSVPRSWSRSQLWASDQSVANAKNECWGTHTPWHLGSSPLGVFGSSNCWQTVVPNSQTTLVRQRISIKLVVEANSGRSWVYDSHVCHWGQQGKHGLASGTPQTRASGTPQNRAGWWKHRKKRPL